jgi:acetylglutamate kinase
VLLEIFTDEGVGTQVLPGVPTKIRTALYRTSAPSKTATKAQSPSKGATS